MMLEKFEQFLSLAEFMNWAMQNREYFLLPEIVAEVIKQDEYSFDLVVPLREASILVFTAT
ncbi:MAG: hypothetical protein JNN15_12555 [Blastocatellia bacterium]|nr:hypothetical protein [Blastocatellia bacterium]